jgi:hypothetical protein
MAGCSKMDSALDQQWIVVNFAPNTTITTALQVRAACSHIPNVPPLPLPAKHDVLDIMYGIRYDTTNASPAEVSQLQVCLNKFSPVVQGVDPEDTGDEGS